MPLSICARMTSGLTAIPQSIAHTTRSTLKLPPSCIEISATSATNELNDSCTAMPRKRPSGSGEPQFDFSAAAGRSFYSTLLAEAIADGHDGWMEDFGEYTPLDSHYANGMDGTRMHNLYPPQYHCAAYDFARAQERPVVRYQRSGFTGSARCATVVWSG